jgi:nucleotide sugar dehydrogenase
MKAVGLIGFGKIGQGIAAQLLGSGLSVRAVDTNPALKDLIDTDSFTSLEPGVAPQIKQGSKESRLTVHTEASVLADCDAAIVCIPLMVQHSENAGSLINFEPFDRCFHAIAQFVHNNTLISLETTVPVGTCRGRIQQIFQSCGKVHGTDYLLVHSPERIKSGTMLEQLRTNPKIIGGLCEAAVSAGVKLYKSFLPEQIVQPVSSIEIAEMIKLAGMVYRDVNIALVNQISQYCDAANLNIQEVVKHANTDNESHLLSPGVGVGGHCTPVYPYFLMDNFNEHDLQFSLAQEGRRINDSMPEYVVNSVCQSLPVSNALILGLSFRPNVKEDTLSSAYQLNKALKSKGVDTFISDPLYSERELIEKGFAPILDIYGRQFDALFLNTAHKEFLDLNFAKLAKLGCKIFVDGRNVFDADRLLSAGILYRGIGKGACQLVDEGVAIGQPEILSKSR